MNPGPFRACGAHGLLSCKCLRELIYLWGRSGLHTRPWNSVPDAGDPAVSPKDAGLAPSGLAVHRGVGAWSGGQRGLTPVSLAGLGGRCQGRQTCKGVIQGKLGDTFDHDAGLMPVKGGREGGPRTAPQLFPSLSLQGDLTLPNYTGSHRFQTRSHTQVPGLGMSTYRFGGYNSTHSRGVITVGLGLSLPGPSACMALASERCSQGEERGVNPLPPVGGVGAGLDPLGDTNFTASGSTLPARHQPPWSIYTPGAGMATHRGLPLLLTSSPLLAPEGPSGPVGSWCSCLPECGLAGFPGRGRLDRLCGNC